MSESPQTQLQRVLEEAKQQSAQQAQRRAASTSTQNAAKEKKSAQKKINLSGNKFAEIFFDESLSPEEKRDAIAKEMSFDKESTKEENKKRLRDLEELKGYLMQKRTDMEKDLIALSDTDSFAEMHEMFVEMNTSLKEFDDSMEPLYEIINAVYSLRQEGPEAIYNMFREIEDDKAAETAKTEKIDELTKAIADQEQSIKDDKAQIILLGEDKKFFGKFGGTKAEAKAKIAELEEGLLTKQADLETAKELLQTTKDTPASQSAFPNHQAEKESLKELLNISSDEHRERRQRLTDAALGFVNTTEDRSESVLEHFTQLRDHLEKLGGANRGFQQGYAILTEASTLAAKSNKATRDELATAPAGETTVGKVQRESKKAEIEEFIAAADSTAVDTVKTYADLAEQSARIMTMTTANREQIAMTNELRTSGIAGVADGLSTALTIVDSAALNESAKLASSTIDSMNTRTNTRSMQESLRQAAGITETTEALNKAAEDLAAVRDVSKAVSDMTRENLKGVTEATARVKDLLGQVQVAVNDVRSANADAEVQQTAGTTGEFNESAGKKKSGNDAKKPAAAPKKPGSGLSDIASLGGK